MCIYVYIIYIYIFIYICMYPLPLSFSLLLERDFSQRISSTFFFFPPIILSPIPLGRGQ